MTDVRIYLVPGFFGFTSIGALNYFHCVSEALRDGLDRCGYPATIVECETQPSGSIARRAERLRRTVAETGGLEARALHFIGHSTGGLDVRLLVTPGVRLAKDRSEEDIGRRTRSVTTVATPHHGTPLATFFTTVQGRYVLLLLAALATTAPGRTAIWAAGRLMALVARLDDVVGRSDTVLDELSRKILRRITLREDDAVWAFLRDIAADQGAILQLTPESMHLFNAAVVDRPGVDYGCVATAAPRPPLAVRGGYLLSARKSLLYGLFTLLHRLSGRAHRHYPYPPPDRELHEPVLAGLPLRWGEHTSDGIVPTASQLHGRLLDAVVSDHLDVVGQFDRSGEPLSDWLPSASSFSEERFAEVWGRVAEAICRADPQGVRGHAGTEVRGEHDERRRRSAS